MPEMKKKTFKKEKKLQCKMLQKCKKGKQYTFKRRGSKIPEKYM